MLKCNPFLTNAVQRFPCLSRMALIISNHTTRLVLGRRGEALVHLWSNFHGVGAGARQVKAIATPSITEAGLDWLPAGPGKRITATEPGKTPPEPIET